MDTGNQTRYMIVPAILLCFVSFLHSQDDKNKIPLFKVGVDTVFLKVLVTDSRGRFVTGIQKTDFLIYEDGVLQTVSNYKQESGPVSIGFVLDVSYSMKSGNQLYSAKNICRQILERSNVHPEDEYFLIAFNEKARLIRSFSREISGIEEAIALMQPSGHTALRDAVYLGMNMFESCNNDKKALILITDGRDNASRYYKSEIREFIKESRVQIYAIPTSKLFMEFLEELAELTGGGIGISIDRVHSELRHQYLLGYVPSNKAQDGAWREIKVKVNTPPGFPKLSIRAKKGYYAPENEPLN